MEPSRPAAEPVNSMDGMEEVIKEFLVESNEGLDRFDRDLLALEKNRSSRELLDSVFRAIHTIKGTGGVLGYEKLVAISHAGESVLSRMRDGRLLLSAEIATALLTMADALRRVVEEIAATGREGDGDFAGVIEQLNAVLEGGKPQPAPSISLPSEAKPLDAELPPRLGDILVASRPANQTTSSARRRCNKKAIPGCWASCWLRPAPLRQQP